MQDKTRKKPAMEVRDLYFSYGKNKVLKGVSLKIEEGKITTILGANGCGKSALFYLMTRNLLPRKGNIFLQGKNILNLGGKEFAKKVSIVHQYNTSSDDITVERLVSFGRTPHMKMMQGRSQEDQRLIRWAMEVTGVEKYRNREVSRLSGGQRQRVWIAEPGVWHHHGYGAPRYQPGHLFLRRDHRPEGWKGDGPGRAGKGH